MPSPLTLETPPVPTNFSIYPFVECYKEFKNTIKCHRVIRSLLRLILILSAVAIGALLPYEIYPKYGKWLSKIGVDMFSVPKVINDIFVVYAGAWSISFPIAWGADIMIKKYCLFAYGDEEIIFTDRRISFLCQEDQLNIEPEVLTNLIILYRQAYRQALKNPKECSMGTQPQDYLKILEGMLNGEPLALKMAIKQEEIVTLQKETIEEHSLSLEKSLRETANASNKPSVIGKHLSSPKPQRNTSADSNTLQTQKIKSYTSTPTTAKGLRSPTSKFPSTPKKIINLKKIPSQESVINALRDELHKKTRVATPEDELQMHLHLPFESERESEPGRASITSLNHEDIVKSTHTTATAASSSHTPLAKSKINTAQLNEKQEQIQQRIQDAKQQHKKIPKLV